MRVVIAGARGRREQEDKPVINALLDNLRRKYSHLLVITTACDRGIGKLVKNKCLPKQFGGKPIIDFVEFSMRIYVEDMSANEFSTLFNSKNRTLVDVGEEFHLFMGYNEQRGVMGNLLQEVVKRGLPYAKYGPNDKEVKEVGVIPISPLEQQSIAGGTQGPLHSPEGLEV